MSYSEPPEREPIPLPEAAPDVDTWAALLWPWLGWTEQLPRSAARLARILAERVDTRDGTVLTTRPPDGTIWTTREPDGMTAWTYDHALRLLVECGLLTSANPGRHRIAFPLIEHVRRGGVGARGGGSR